MSQLMETLESRTLFTASAGVILADFDALKAQGALAKAELKAALSQAKADVKTLKESVLAAHPTTTQKATFNTLLKDEAAGAVKYKARVTAILTTGKRDADHLFGLLKSFKAHPTSIVIKAKVHASLSVLQGVFSDTALTNLQTMASNTVTTLDTDLNAVAVAIPSAQTDVTSFESHLAADLTTLASQGAAIQTGVAKIATDLA